MNTSQDNKLQPLVSIVCLCYNHADFVKEAIRSVYDQSYQNIELIVADDASTDNSVSIIKKACKGLPAQCLFLKENVGNCTAFNEALALCKGKYIIDLSADDVLHPDRVALQVAALEQAETNYGICYSDAYYIDKNSRITGQWSVKRGRHRPKPKGDVYKEILKHSFICAPTVMIRKSVLNELQGYDQSLTFEDFDLWVRTARRYHFTYVDEPLTLKRELPNSWGTARLRQRQIHHLPSVWKVCKKAQAMNQTPEENEALAQRVAAHLRQSALLQSKGSAKLFYALLKELRPLQPVDTFWWTLARYHFPLYAFKQLLDRLKGGLKR